jgi:hypothetical protein
VNSIVYVDAAPVIVELLDKEHDENGAICIYTSYELLLIKLKVVEL